MANAWDVFAPALLDQVQKRSFVYAATAPEDFMRIGRSNAGSAIPRRTTAIARASLGSDAGLLGAARLAMIASADLSGPEPKHASAEVGRRH